MVIKKSTMNSDEISMIPVMASKRPKINLYVDESIHESLQMLAKVDRRSITNMVEVLVIEALQHRGIVEKPEMPTVVLPSEDEPA